MSTQELLNAMAALRGEGILSEVLSGATADSGSGEHERSPYPSQHHTPRAPQGLSAAADELDDPDDVSRSPKGKEFLKQRALDREEIGTLNWIARHREDLSRSEKRRLENRLRAEHLYATAKMELEQFKHEASIPISDLVDHEALQEAQSASRKAVQSRRSASPAKAIPYEYTAPLEQPETSPSPMAQPIVQPHHHHQRTVAERSPPPVPVAQPLGHEGVRVEPQGDAQAASPAIEESLPPIDESSNYESKRRMAEQQGELEASTTGLLSRAISKPPQHSDSRGETPSFYAASQQLLSEAAFTSPPGGDLSPTSNARLRHALTARSQDITELVDAVQQRDKTINRLERQIRDDRNHYEETIDRLKREMETTRSTADRRVATLRAQLEEMMQQSATSHNTAMTDAQRSIQQTQDTFAKYSQDLHTEMNSLMRNYQLELDTRLKEVIDTNDYAVRQAREAYLVERGEVISLEKQQLVEHVSREQDLLLREAEVYLRDQMEKEVIESMRKDLAYFVKEQASSQIIPSIRELFSDDMKRKFAAEVNEEVDRVVAKKAHELRAEIREEVSAGNEQLRALATTLAAETMLRTSELAGQEEVQKHLAIFQDLQREAERLAAKNKRESDAHSVRMSEAADEVKRLTKELTAEREVSSALAEEVLKLKMNKRSVLD